MFTNIELNYFSKKASHNVGIQKLVILVTLIDLVLYK